VTERKRFAYWVIVAGAQPTSFRARHAEDLLPTLRQLQRTQPGAALKWFERGRFWDSKEAAADQARERRKPTDRGPDWRPGGSHADPRARYKLTRDQKRARFKRNLIRNGSDATPDEADQSAEDQKERRSKHTRGTRPTGRPVRNRPARPRERSKGPGRGRK